MIINTSEWLSCKDAVSYIGRSKQTLYNWINDGLVETVRLGNQTFFKKVDLEKVKQDKKKRMHYFATEEFKQRHAK